MRKLFHEKDLRRIQVSLERFEKSSVRSTLTSGSEQIPTNK